MASQESTDGGAAASPSGRKDWWVDWEGYWRDQVLKDLVKFGSQVIAGVFVGVLLGLIKPDDARSIILAWIATGGFAVFAVSCSVGRFLRLPSPPWPVVTILPLFAWATLAKLYGSMPRETAVDMTTVMALGVAIIVVAEVLRWSTRSWNWRSEK